MGRVDCPLRVHRRSFVRQHDKQVPQTFWRSNGISFRSSFYERTTPASPQITYEPIRLRQFRIDFVAKSKCRNHTNCRISATRAERQQKWNNVRKGINFVVNSVISFWYSEFTRARTYQIAAGGAARAHRYPSNNSNYIATVAATISQPA